MCIYTDVNKSGSVCMPEEMITKEKSRFYICLAGEILNEVLGAESLRRGFQEKLNKFEEEN